MKANQRNKSDEGKRTGSASPHQRRGRRGMTRIDRKTGELILSPKLTVDQLYAMANEPGWRPWMRLIAEHPHAWPELAEWWHTAQEQGFDTAGAAPLPPVSMRGRRRVAIPSAPLPPEDEPGQEPVSAPAEQSPPDDSAEKALKDADDDFAALERIADLESDTADIPPIPEAESSGGGGRHLLGRPRRSEGASRLPGRESARRDRHDREPHRRVLDGTANQKPSCRCHAARGA